MRPQEVVGPQEADGMKLCVRKSQMNCSNAS